MKCINCPDEALGRSKYCSDHCKLSYNRRKSVTEIRVSIRKIANGFIVENLGGGHIGIEHVFNNTVNLFIWLEGHFNPVQVIKDSFDDPCVETLDRASTSCTKGTTEREIEK